MNISENTLSDVEKTICNKYNNSLMCELKQCNLLVNFTEYYPWVFSCNLTGKLDEMLYTKFNC